MSFELTRINKPVSGIIFPVMCGVCLFFEEPAEQSCCKKRKMKTGYFYSVFGTSGVRQINTSSSIFFGGVVTAANAG